MFSVHAELVSRATATLPQYATHDEPLVRYTNPRNLSSTKNSLNTGMLRQNGRHFADDNFKRIFLTENVRISMKTSVKFVP